MIAFKYISGAGYVGNASNLLATQPKDGFQYASMLGVLITPLSRGNVTLKSADTTDLPVINPNWLDDQADQEVAIAMFKRMRQAFQSKAMEPVVIGEEYNPGPHVQSDEQILEFIKHNVMPIWHAACTCKMGTSDDEMAVVDSRARVYGVDRLRVVDASAFPFLPPGHPQSTVCESIVCFGLLVAHWRHRYACREDRCGYYPGFIDAFQYPL
jgi:choline dehydrogenase